jgi:hypothetical protein
MRSSPGGRPTTPSRPGRVAGQPCSSREAISLSEPCKPREPSRTRTGDPFITSDGPVSAPVRSGHPKPLVMRDSADRTGLEVTGEDNPVDGWWTARMLTASRTHAWEERALSERPPSSCRALPRRPISLSVLPEVPVCAVINSNNARVALASIGRTECRAQLDLRPPGVRAVTAIHGRATLSVPRPTARPSA